MIKNLRRVLNFVIALCNNKLPYGNTGKMIPHFKQKVNNCKNLSHPLY